MDRSEQALLHRVQAYFDARRFLQPIVGADVMQMQASEGIDFATAALYVYFAKQIEEAALRQKCASRPGGAASCMAIVPGAFYQEHPHLGADGRDVAQAAARRGWCCELVPTDGLGTLEANAEHILQWFDRRQEEYIAVVSFSKGTADFQNAVARRTKILERIGAWISVSGIWNGTQMADWLLERKRLRPALWWLKHRYGSNLQAISDLRYREPYKTAGIDARTTDSIRIEGSLGGVSECGLPTAVLAPILVHVAGFPLRRHLSCWRARLWHRRLRRDGPNDSVTLLTDLLDAPGIVVPVWGADHYLRTKRRNSSWDGPNTIVDLAEGRLVSHLGQASP